MSLNPAMDFWQRARTFAEETAKRSQELTREAAKRSQDLTIGSSKLSEIVSEASKRSKEIAAEASKRADQIKAEAIKRADQIKAQIPPAAVALSSLVDAVAETTVEQADLERFGVTDELREFVKGITLNTFRDFPLEDDQEMSDIPPLSNVRQDLTAWQEKHAKLVLLTVKEISKLRYELCPRVMKERKFWRIYFILVNSHVAPFEKRYMEEAAQIASEQVQDNKMRGASSSETTSKTETGSLNQKTSSVTEQDLDVFLLGDLGDSDDGPDEGDGGFDDDFDKI
ncbi:ATP synthase subunit b like [Actinidia chinensis var. chinensis]|uniref:ATP synthase subunit b like n=1 Tax=Actinidia chinensis var. chinensis TaxID=1590841 RepID=A0A2R6PCI2_ACTCC|nr:ATP synthase subunit b like [Actinidia chinensis var. chinensis]